jgi:hypothetical protein
VHFPAFRARFRKEPQQLRLFVCLDVVGAQMRFLRWVS